MPAQGGTPTIVKTGAAQQGTTALAPANLLRNRSGNLVAEFQEAQRTRFQPGICDGGWLVGNNRGSQVYLLGKDPASVTTVDTCTFRVQ